MILLYDSWLLKLVYQIAMFHRICIPSFIGKLKMFVLRQPPRNTIRHCPCCIALGPNGKRGRESSLLDPMHRRCFANVGYISMQMRLVVAYSRQNCHQQHPEFAFAKQLAPLSRKNVVERDTCLFARCAHCNVCEFAKMTVILLDRICCTFTLLEIREVSSNM